MDEYLTYKGNTFKIMYSHEHSQQPNNIDYPLRYKGKYSDRLVIKGITKAFIINEKGEKVLEATAMCSQKDVFNKNLGRIIAKGRLIKKSKE